MSVWISRNVYRFRFADSDEVLDLYMPTIASALDWFNENRAALQSAGQVPEGDVASVTTLAVGVVTPQ